MAHSGHYRRSKRSRKYGSKRALNGELRVANGKYRLGKRLGSGSFGVIYEGTHIITGSKVAVKLEKAEDPHPQLKYEARIYKIMKGSFGVPNVKFYGCEDEYNILVIDLLGPSLEDLFNFCNKTFSLKTILMLADQMVCILSYFMYLIYCLLSIYFTSNIWFCFYH